VVRDSSYCTCNFTLYYFLVVYSGMKVKKANNIDLIITDLDGTLLNSHHSVSKKDLQILRKLKQKGIYSVIATGRSFFSVKKVLPMDFPIDYLIFSCGAGIMEWNSKNIIFSSQMDPQQVVEISKKLISMDLDFMIQSPIPDNHKFFYYHSGRENPDFHRRIELYKKFAEPLNTNLKDYGPASQIIAISEDGKHIFSKIKNKIKNIHIVRSTSPLDYKTNWIEIFAQGISKAHTARWLCDKLGISHNNTLAIGNDYNDVKLLEWANASFVVENAPEEIKECFTVTKSNNNSGFSEAVKKVIEI